MRKLSVDSEDYYCEVFAVCERRMACPALAGETPDSY
jgi:hypothetical protein